MEARRLRQRDRGARMHDLSSGMEVREFFTTRVSRAGFFLRPRQAPPTSLGGPCGETSHRRAEALTLRRGRVRPGNDLALDASDSQGQPPYRWGPIMPEAAPPSECASSGAHGLWKTARLHAVV